MTVIYETDARGVYTGNTQVIGGFDGAPPGWFREAPPSASDGKVAARVGDGWDLIDPPPAPAPAPTGPQEVTRRAGFAAIFMMYGMTKEQLVTKIQQVITDPTQQYLVVNEVLESQVFQRQRPIVIQMAAVLEWDLDALFALAASLT